MTSLQKASSRKMCDLVESNLNLCGVPEEQAAVVASDALEFLRRAEDGRDRETWDIAFFDPPYSADYASVLAIFAKGVALRRRGGVLIVEHHFENGLPEMLGVMRRWRTIRQGESCLSFYERRQ